jgi:DnaK suppressor protein
MAKKTTKANAKSTAKKTSKKDQSLSKKELENYRVLLVEKWQEIVGDVTTMEENLFQGGGELSSMPVHMADVGSDSFEQDFGLDLLAEEKKILVEIQHALKRIETGDFGICEGLGIPIEKRRLEAIPWTRYSLEYAQQLEQGQGGFKYRALKSRPIDIDREDDIEEEEDEEDSGDQIESEEDMESLDALDEDEDEEEDEREV